MKLHLPQCINIKESYSCSYSIACPSLEYIFNYGSLAAACHLVKTIKLSSEDRKLLKACKAPKTKPGLILTLATPLMILSGGLTSAFKGTSAVCWYGAVMTVNSSDASPSLILAGKGCWLPVLT